MGDLGKTVYETCDLLAKIRSYRVEIDQRIFDHIVKQPSRDADFIEFHVGEDLGHFDGMDKIWLARCSGLAAMMKCREEVRAANEIDIGVWPIYAHFVDDIFDPDHLSRLETA